MRKTTNLNFAMEGPPHLSSLKSRDLKKLNLKCIPALSFSTSSLSDTNAWLNAPPFFKQCAESINLTNEIQLAQEVLSDIAGKPHEWQLQPGNIYESVLKLVQSGAIGCAVSVEEASLYNMLADIKESKRSSLNDVDTASRFAKAALGRKFFFRRCVQCLVCALVSAFWGCEIISHIPASMRICLSLGLCADIANGIINNQSVLMNNSVHKRKQLQLEIDSLLRALNQPVSLKAFSMKNLSPLQHAYFCADIFLHIAQLYVFFSILNIIYVHWKPLSSGVSWAQLCIYCVLFFLHGCAVYFLLYRREERRQMKSEEDELCRLVKNLCCTYDASTNAFQFPLNSMTAHSSSLLTRSSADYRDFEWSYWNQDVLVSLTANRDNFVRSVRRSKLKALVAKVGDILLALEEPRGDKALSYHADVIVSNCRGMNLCYFALVDLLEDHMTFDCNDRAACIGVLERMHRAESIEMQRLNRLISNLSIVRSLERYNQILYFVSSKRVLFHPELQKELFHKVRDYLVRHELHQIKLQAELTLSTSKEGWARLGHLTSMLEAMGLEERRGEEEDTYTEEQRHGEDLSRVQRALAHFLNGVKLLSAKEERECSIEEEKKSAIEGPRDREIRAVPRYYHPSLFRTSWDCCGRVDPQSTGCRVDFVQRGHRLQIYHHPLPFTGKEYDCCGEESRSARGCREGFHPSPFLGEDKMTQNRNALKL